MLRRILISTSILTIAASFSLAQGCSSSSGSAGSSTSSGSSSGGGDDATGSSSGVSSSSSGSTGDDSGSSSGSSGSSSGAGDDSGSGGACTPPASVPANQIPPYATVAQTKGACTGAQISSFMAGCFSSTQSMTACNNFQMDAANAGCVNCLFGVTGTGDAAAASESGAVLLDYTFMSFFASNQPGCIALEDPTNGPACATALEPLLQCNLDACGNSMACTSSQSVYTTCLNTANGNGGACASQFTAAQTPCAAYFAADAGLGTTGACSTDQDVISVICGNGSGDGG